MVYRENILKRNVTVCNEILGYVCLLYIKKKVNIDKFDKFCLFLLLYSIEHLNYYFQFITKIILIIIIN